MQILQEIKVKTRGGTGINEEEALELLRAYREDGNVLEELFEITEKLTRIHHPREKFQGCSDGFALYDGQCSHECPYCPVSHHKGSDGTSNWQLSKEKGYLPEETITVKGFVKRARMMRKLGATHFKIVLTERTIRDENDPKRFGLALEAFQAIREKLPNLTLCASMGALTQEQLQKLKEAGVTNINCSFESSERVWQSENFDGTALSLDDKILTNQLAGEVGLKRCSGFMAGMGEMLGDRIWVFLKAQEMGIESFPFNIFVPPFNGFQDRVDFAPEDMLFSIALGRLIMPKTSIIINNGNLYFEYILAGALKAGATGIGIKGPKDNPCFIGHKRIKLPFKELRKIRRRL